MRTFGHRVLDMLELGLDAESFRRLAQFRGKKPAVGLRPMLVFAGPAFESTVPDEFTMAKSMLTDFFAGERGPGSDKVDVEGLQYVIVISADEAEATAAGLGDGSVSKPAIHLRSYLIQTKRSGQRLPRVEVSLLYCPVARYRQDRTNTHFSKYRSRRWVPVWTSAWAA